MALSAKNTVQVPSTATFSFRAPPLDRPVSLSISSSPRITWNFRDDTGFEVYGHINEKNADKTPPKSERVKKIENDVKVGCDDTFALQQERKPRKMWSDEETGQLVAGCNKHGVGNWKAILHDTTFHFENRSPVDLKDRFRTRFPDAYRENYPNARTHLSKKVCSTLSDGSPLFEKPRSQMRPPFTEAEDRALEVGVKKYGSDWTTIVKDPVFRERGRRPTDLRGRFRNTAAGSKARSPSKKRMGRPSPEHGNDRRSRSRHGTEHSATDNQLVTSNTMNPRSSRRGFSVRRRMKSVQRTMAEGDDSSSGEDDVEDTAFKMKSRPTTVGNTSTDVVEATKEKVTDLDQLPLMVDSLGIVDFFSYPEPGAYASLNTTTDVWTGGHETPVDPSWTSTSPTSPYPFTDYFKEDTMSPHAVQLPVHAHNSEHLSPVLQRIGDSTWDTQEYSSVTSSSMLDHPRSTEHTTPLSSFRPHLSLSSSPLQTPNSDTLSPSPFVLSASFPSSTYSRFTHPYTLSHSQHLHGVVDRYDLVAMDTGGVKNDTSSGIGVLETHSPPFPDEMSSLTEFNRFMKHSIYAGDLILGSRNYEPFGSSNEYSGGDGYVGYELGLALSGMDMGGETMRPIAEIPAIDEVLSDVAGSVHGVAGTSIKLGGRHRVIKAYNQDDNAFKDLDIIIDGHDYGVSAGGPRKNEDGSTEDGRNLEMEFSLDDLSDLLGSGWDLNFDVDMKLKAHGIKL